MMNDTFHKYRGATITAEPLLLRDGFWAAIMYVHVPGLSRYEFIDKGQSASPDDAMTHGINASKLYVDARMIS